jgi:hypothetical protein
MRIGIMQPYFLSYLGYFQLIKACDKFVVYDNIKFTKNGWIRRNRMLLNNKDSMFSIPLKSDSDFLNIDQRFIGDNFEKEKVKILGQIKTSYNRAPFLNDVYPLIEDIFNYNETNLFNFILNSIIRVNAYLSIETPIIISSKIDMDHNLKGELRVIEIVKRLKGNAYINPIGGIELYKKEDFKANDIDLFYHKMKPIIYTQYDNDFIPSLSILDVMMFNDKPKIKYFLTEFDLI